MTNVNFVTKVKLSSGYIVLMAKAILLCLLLNSHGLVAKPLVIAHRGASGYLPEHTLAATTLAFSQGADYIEQDVVASKDGELVVLHDIYLAPTTNVEDVFPDKKRADGKYYAIDFTWAELQRLKVHERQTEQRNQVYANRYQGQGPFVLSTLAQHIELISQLNRQLSKQVGLYIEVKAPAWHLQHKLDLSAKVIDVLRAHQLDSGHHPVFIQCFDFDELKRIKHTLKSNVRLIQLIGENSWLESSTDYDWIRSEQGLTRVADIAYGVGPWLPHIIDIETGEQTDLVSRAHKLGLKVHGYTFRVDSLPSSVTTQQAMVRLLNEAKIDGVFTDFPDVVRKFVDDSLHKP